MDQARLCTESKQMKRMRRMPWKFSSHDLQETRSIRQRKEEIERRKEESQFLGDGETISIVLPT